MPFASHLGPAEPHMFQRQERQIVQSQLNLDDFLPGFAFRFDRLSGVRSNHLSYRPLQGQKS